MEQNQSDELATLEEHETTLETPQTVPGPADSPSAGQPEAPTVKKRFIRERITKVFSAVNIYFLAFILVLIISVVAIFIGIRFNNKGSGTNLSGKALSAEELRKLQTTDAKVGDPKQTLTIESNTVITGQTLLRNDLDVAGTIRVGGSVNLPGITVSGQSNFEQIQASRLTITGDTSVQGQLTVQRNLAVSGGASFGGTVSAAQLAIQTLQLSGDLQLNRHIDAGGGGPGKSDGASLGGGGTSSISGSDTAGTVTINTGSGPSAGCYITVNFSQKFNGTPHVVVTPVGAGAAGLNYYVNRSSANFSLCSTSSPAAGSSFSFDYIIID